MVIEESKDRLNAGGGHFPLSMIAIIPRCFGEFDPEQGQTGTDEEAMPELIGYVESGRVKPIIAKTYPLKEIVEAQKAFLSKKYTGKIVLRIS